MDNLLERVWEGSSEPIRKGEVVNQVYETGDYSIFKLHKRNRSVITRPDMIEQARLGIVNPIMVNGEMIVIDGQNRLHHSIEAGVPVKYIIDETLTIDDITRMNTNQEKWTLRNWVESYSNDGNKEYEGLIYLVNHHYSGLTATAAISMNRISPSMISKHIRDEEFHINNYDKVVEFFQYFKRFKEKVEVRNNDKLILAIFQLFRLNKFDGERLISKVISTRFDEELQNKSLTQRGNLNGLLESYNGWLGVSSDQYINYHITSKRQIILKDPLSEWAEKKTAKSSDQNDK